MRVALTLVLMLVAAACADPDRQVEQARRRAGSWAVTVKAVTEQWAQSRLSLRFTRTTLDTAMRELRREADSLRPTDAAAAARLDRLQQAIEPVMAAVVRNQPAVARERGARLPAVAGAGEGGR